MICLLKDKSWNKTLKDSFTHRTSSNVSSVNFNEREAKRKEIWLLFLNSTGIDFDDYIFVFFYILNWTIFGLYNLAQNQTFGMK